MIISDIAGAFGRFFSNKDESSDPLVRLFRIEYANDYRNARRQGVSVNRNFVKDFLDNR